jgi:hypothetical protein
MKNGSILCCLYFGESGDDPNILVPQNPCVPH